MAGIDCGLLLVDKPAGITSHDVVDDVRRRFGVKRVGHAGTLDPFATGLLMLLLGRATRLQRYMLHLPKTYRVVAHLGWTSTTGDRDGDLTQTGQVPSDPQLPVGELELPVPAYSAIKVDGRRLYKRARAGEEFAPPVRKMVVYRARRMALSGEMATFELDCSGGTYVRSVVATLEDAYCDELVRLKIGELPLEDADPERIVDPLDGLAHLRRTDVDLTGATDLMHGRGVTATIADNEPVSLVFNNTLIGVGRVDAGVIRPETMLVGSPADIERIAADGDTGEPA